MTKQNYPNTRIYWHKEIYAAWQLSVQWQQPTVYSLVNKTLVSPYNDHLQALLGVQVGSVSQHEPNTRVRPSDVYAL